MKVWAGFGSEHSSNLVIIGEFKEVADAKEAALLLDEATRISRTDEAKGIIKAGEIPNKFSNTMLDFIGSNSLALSHVDVQQLLYDYSLTQENNRLVITTEEYDVNVFLNMMVHKGAKVQVYSAHDYKSPYGRQTAK